MQWLHLRGKTPSAAWRGLIGGLSDIELRHGYRRAVEEFGGKDDYPPTLAQFKRLCVVTAEDMGLPTAGQAYRLATTAAHPCFEGQWAGREVYHAARLVGFQELATLPEVKSWPMFEAAWAKTVKAVLAGESLEDIPPEPKRLEHVHVMNKEAARESLNRIYATLGVKHGHQPATSAA